MAIVDDLFSVTILSEHDGVQMSNKLYFEIDDIGDDANPSIQLANLLTEYHDSIKPIASDQWKIVCGIWDNITTPEGTHKVFVTLPGLAVNTGHPQFVSFRVNRYAQNVAADAIKRGAFNQAGIEEAQSVRGRISSPAAFTSLLTFLGVTTILGGTGWTIQPLLRWTFAIGPPPVYEYVPIRKQEMSSKVMTLASRNTQLCATT